MSKLKANYIFNLLYTVLNIVFPVLSFPYVAGIIGPEGVGKVQFIMAFTQYFALLAALGLPIYGLRKVAQISHDPELLKRTLGELVFIHIVFSLVLTLAYIAIIFTLPYFTKDLDLYVVAGLIIMLGFSSVDWYFSGLENFRLIAMRSLFIKLIAFIALFVFIRKPGDFDLYLYISVFTVLGNNIINIFSIRNQIVFSVKSLRQHFRPLMFTFGTTLATSMYTMLDSVLIGALADERSVGLYSASIRLTRLSVPIAIASAIVLMPRISKLFVNKNFGELEVILNKSMNLILLIAVPMSAGFLILAPELIIVFSSLSFDEAIPTMRILAPLTMIIGLGYFWGFQILTPAAKDREMLFSVLIGMAINLILSFILIPLYRQNGAAIANVFSELVVTAGYMFFAYRIIPFRVSLRPLFFSIISSLPFVGIVWFLRNLDLNIYVFLLIAICSCALGYLAVQFAFFNRATILELAASVINKKKKE